MIAHARAVLRALIAAGLAGCPACADDDRWWPTQAMPRALVRTGDMHAFPEPTFGHQVLVQSIAGLAAGAVNEGHFDEMVWVGTGNLDLEDWYAQFLKRHPNVEDRGMFGPWPLVDRYAARGLIKGYILFKADRSDGELNQHRRGMDRSLNVATSLAGLLGGVVVEEALECEAKARGLPMLLDARDKTQAWCFATYKGRFNRRMIATQDPQKPHIRDLAIARKAFTFYGADAPAAEALAWLEPLAPVLGWNGGDEYETTRLSSVHGQIQTATDWCMNLPVLMAGREHLESARPPTFDPRTIDRDDRRDAISFVQSDGDNVQWLQGNFFREPSRSYWGNPERGTIAFGWSTCFAQLAQLAPMVVDHAVATRTRRDSFVEWGGGYYYPELFAAERPDRWALAARHAARTWALMQRSNTRIIAFNAARPDSPDALQAYRTFAGQAEGLLAILVFQYAPYEGGAGRTFWVRGRSGVEVPVITARYSIWSQTNDRPRSGTPAKVAREIRESVESTPATDRPRLDWAIAHAWSYFRVAPGADEDAENMPQEDAANNGGVRGYSPAVRCAERLPPSIRVIGTDELAWRVRLKHDPAATTRLIETFRP